MIQCQYIFVSDVAQCILGSYESTLKGIIILTMQADRPQNGKYSSESFQMQPANELRYKNQEARNM